MLEKRKKRKSRRKVLVKEVEGLGSKVEVEEVRCVLLRGQGTQYDSFGHRTPGASVRS